jgi:hypothetical protein
MEESHTGDLRGQGLPELAYYYPEPVIADAGWLKNALLVFDGVALLVPEYMQDRPLQFNEETTRPLAEQGLLQLLKPETLVDQEVAERLAESMTELITRGAFDALPPALELTSISLSRLGYYGDPGLADMIYSELRGRQLAAPSADGGLSVPVHPIVRLAVLLLLAQFLRPKGKAIGLDLSPLTDKDRLQAGLAELLALPQMPTAGRVIQSDLADIGLDMTLVPLDELLDFRASRGRDLRRYRRDVRRFAREVLLLPEEERTEALADRREALQDRLADINRDADPSWRSVGKMILGFVGALVAWSGSPISAALSAGQGALEYETSHDADAFSYLLAAEAKLSRPSSR